MTPDSTTSQVNDTLNHFQTYDYPKHVLGNPRPIRIGVIGAGLSGIAAVKLYKDRFKNKGLPVELTVYEKNSDVGGTWLENRYPGCACDVPAHAYTFSWEGNPRWSQAYVTSPELLDYFQGRARAYGVYDYLKLNHRVVETIWQETVGKWELHIEDLEKERTLVEEFEVVINATGFLNKWKWPDIPGIDTYQGDLVHSANWDDDIDFANKKVAVIGNGSSAIQIVPKMQPVVEHLISFNRSPTWITPEFGEQFACEGRDSRFSEEQMASWEANPKEYLAYRKEVESYMNKIIDILYKDSTVQKDSYQQFRKAMQKKLSAKPHLVDKLVPKFAVGCRRLTPGHNYLEALVAENVTVETGTILKISPTGIHMDDGTFHEVDAVICATGFDTSFRPAFPVIGEGGKDLRQVWAHEPRSYLSVAASGFPNFFFTSGPNFTIANGTLVPCLESCVSYAYEAVSKIQRQGIKSLSPKPEAVDDFQEHKDAIMNDLAWTSGCRSWYKFNGKVWGPWPGSAVHFLEVMAEPRWEDWDIKYATGNRFAFLGNGMTEREVNGGDLSWYLKQPGA